MMPALPDEDSPMVKQFAWVTEWLTKNNLLKTLDSLLEEFEPMLDQVGGLVQEQTFNKTTPSEPICVLKGTFSSLHNSSILSVNFHPSRPWLLSTDSSKNLVVSSLRDGCVLSRERTNNPFRGAIITLDCNPRHHQLVVIGTMDEHHALLELVEEDPTSTTAATAATIDAPFSGVVVKTLQMWNLHKKYVVRTKWNPDGNMFATASHDGSVAVYRLNDECKEAELVKQIFFNGPVEAIEWTKDGKKLIASVRDDPCLQYINIDTWEVFLANANVLGDGHVSFTILELKVSPDGKKLLASTDHSRAILFQQGTPIQIRNFYGFENDSYSQPRTVFDNQGLAYMTSQDNHIYVFDVATGRLLHKFLAHSSMVRDINYLPKEDLIVTSSYDKTIKIWERRLITQEEKEKKEKEKKKEEEEEEE